MARWACLPRRAGAGRAARAARGIAPWKLAGAAILAVAGVALVVLAAAVLVARPASSPAEDSAQAPEPTLTPGPQPDGQEPRVIGPYYIAPAADGRPPEEGFVPANANLPAGPPAAGLEPARRSSLFPGELPEGYRVIAGHSLSQPAESYLQLTLEGPAGQLIVALSRPATLPVWVAYEDTPDAELQFRGRDMFAIVPVNGSTGETSVRGFYHGVDAVVSARGVDADVLADVLRDLLPSRFSPSHLTPALPPESERLPLAQDVVASGPCRLTPSVTTDYVYRGGRITLVVAVDCTGLVPFSACPPTYTGPIDGLDVACDDRGYRIDARWQTSIADSATCRAGHPMVIQDGRMLGGMDCGAPVNGASGTLVPVHTCVSVRDQESCANFEYRMP